MRAASLNNKYIKPCLSQTHEIYIASIAKERHRSISCKINKDNQTIKFQTRPDQKLQIFHQIVTNKKRMVFSLLKRIFKMRQKPHETLFLYDALLKGSLDNSKFKQIIINKPIYNYISLNFPAKYQEKNQNVKAMFKKIEKIFITKMNNAFRQIRNVNLKLNQISLDKRLQDTYEDNKLTTTVRSFKSSDISYFKNHLLSIQMNKNSRNSSQKSRSRKSSTANIINVTFTSIQGSPCVSKTSEIRNNFKNQSKEMCFQSPMQNHQKNEKQHKSALLNKQKDNISTTHIGQRRRKQHKITFLEDEIIDNESSFCRMKSFYQ